MIHIVTSENRSLYAPELAALRAQRRGPLEDDGVDGAGTVRLLAFDDAMRLEAALRLDPTQQRCRLAEAFADLIAPGEPLVVDSGVWEATGLFAACRADASAGGPSRLCALWAAAMELALVNGVDRIVGVIDMALYPGVLNMPIEVRLAGVPRAHAQGVAAAVELAVSRARLDRLRESLGVVGPVGYHVDALDLRAFGGLGEVQRQVASAQIPQLGAGSARDEALCAEVLFRVSDNRRDSRLNRADRDARPLPERLNA